MKGRELMFRAWDEKYKVMITSDFNFIGEVTLFGGIESMLHEINEQHCDTTPSLIRLNDVVIMQSTGSIDNEGKKIYEGDLIVSENEDGELFLLKVIFDQIYSHDIFSFSGFKTEEILNITKNYQKYISDEQIECLPIVIGNIYENSSLIK